MPTRRASIFRNSFAVVALSLIAALGLLAAPVRATLDTQSASDATSLGVPQNPVAPLTTTFGPNVRANSDVTNFGQHEPSLAVSRTNPDVVVASSKDYRDGNVKHVWIDVSTDGGVTWPADRQLQIPGIPAALNIQSDPVVMARDDGRIYVACLATNDAQSSGGIFITWTDDNGVTWRNPSVPTRPAPQCSIMKLYTVPSLPLPDTTGKVYSVSLTPICCRADHVTPPSVECCSTT